MADYAADVLVRDARAQYFAANKLSDGGYLDRWVKFKIGPFRLWLPNTKARVAAVRFHDIHHVLTGYETTWTDEAAIAAWEVASGCGRHYAAWLLNLAAMAIGLGISFKSVTRAFWRGRYSRNLYGSNFDENLLTLTVGALRKQLDLDLRSDRPRTIDRVVFVAWSVVSILTLILIAAIYLSPIWIPLAIFC